MNDFNAHSGINAAKARGAYLDALRAIIRFDEAATGGLLNKSRDAVLGNRHWTTLTDADFHVIKDDLTTTKFNGLYGDFHSTSKGPWIRDKELIQMVGRHIFELGTQQDIQAFQTFRNKSLGIDEAAPKACAA